MWSISPLNLIFDAKHKYKSNWKSPFGADEKFKIQCRFYHDDELMI